MSTIVVVKKDGVAAIGADTLTSYGNTLESADYVHNASKILQVGDSRLAFVGHASWDLILRHYFAKRKEPPRLDSPQAIFEMSLHLHKALKEEYFLKPEEDEEDDFESSRLDCLIANPTGIFGLFAMRSVMEYAKFSAYGSGYKFALGAMHAVYATDAPAEAVARAGLAASADFDDSTGLPLEVFAFPLNDAPSA